MQVLAKKITFYESLRVFTDNIDPKLPILIIQTTVKPVLSGHSKIDKTKVFKTDGSLMQVESIAECSLGAFCNTFDPH